jgi:probable HAF family extracellular repeat protein
MKLSLLASFVLGLSAVAASHAQTYALTDLGPFRATGINNAGQVVGISHTAGGTHATLWSNGSITDLGTLGGSLSEAYGINNAGQIVGGSYTAGDAAYRATLWSNGSINDLGSLGRNSVAYGINNEGQVVGRSGVANDTASRATLWSNGSITDLGTLGGSSSNAYAINDAAQVVGNSGVVGYSDINGNTSASHATLWSNGSITDLGTLGGAYSSANAINNAGQVAGTSNIVRNIDPFHATLWSNGSITDLGTLEGFASGSGARAINNAGQVVGSSSSYIPGPPYGSSASRATLWSNGVAKDLNSFLDAATVEAGWVMTAAVGINDNGWIVGSAYNETGQKQHAFLLTPIPEPGSWAMLIAGLGVLVATRRRVQ